VVGDAIRALKAGTDKPIVIYPNSGEEWDAGARGWHGSWDHGSLSALAPQWMDAGARLIGGCCRTGPRDIAALAVKMREP
jgi:homocysteine S-methyltransferase